MDSFFLYLPSNVKDVFNRNTIGNFITRLPTPLRLGDHWKVGIAEITFTKSWYNIEKVQKVRLVDDVGNVYQNGDIFIERGSYLNSEELVDLINSKILDLCALVTAKTEKDCSPPKVEYNKWSKRVTLYAGFLGNRTVYLSLDQQISEILGLQQTAYSVDGMVEYEIFTESIKGMQTVRSLDINAGIHSLFVYCDVVKATIVGDSYSQILRTVQVPNVEFGQTVKKIYDRPHYYPLNSREFQTIEIDIKNDSGETIRFEEGRVIVVLHFKNESL